MFWLVTGYLILADAVSSFSFFSKQPHWKTRPVFMEKMPFHQILCLHQANRATKKNAEAAKIRLRTV